MAMGSDTGGSIRIPASFCGTVGLKPTIGRISRYGVMPLNFTLDHMGPLTRSIRDAALALNVLAGHDPRDESSSREPVRDYLPAREVSIRDLRLGLAKNFYFDNLDSRGRVCGEEHGGDSFQPRRQGYRSSRTGYRGNQHNWTRHPVRRGLHGDGTVSE